jgi:hypothetical protein
MAAIALTYLLEAFALIQINLFEWFDYLDKEAAKASAERKRRRKRTIIQ